MSAINQRNNALSVLDSNLGQISKIYKECFLAMGRGALLVYAIDVIEGSLPNRHDYRKKQPVPGTPYLIIDKSQRI